MAATNMLNLRSLSLGEIIELTDQEPFIAFFFHQSVVKEDDTMKFAAGVYVEGGRPHLLLNPTMMNSFSTREKIGVIVHEYLHVGLTHCTKRVTGIKEWHRLENIAKDIAINQLITDPTRDNWDLPEGCMSHTDPRFNFPANLSAEEYFLLLREKYKSKEEMEKGLGDGSDDGFDDHGQWGDESDPANSQAIKEMAKAYQKANGNKMGRALGAGSQAARFIEEIMAVEKYEIDWKTRARMWMHRIVDNKPKFTYKRFSRRYGEPFPGTKYKTKNKVLAIVDTSGSMSSKWLAHIGGQLNLMSKIMQIDVVFVDADVHGSIKKFKPTNALAFPGRGGTDMQPGFDFAAEEGYRGIVCFTDGGLFRQPVSSITTLWVVCNCPHFKAPFGQVVHTTWEDG